MARCAGGWRSPTTPGAFWSSANEVGRPSVSPSRDKAALMAHPLAVSISSLTDADGADDLESDPSTEVFFVVITTVVLLVLFVTRRWGTRPRCHGTRLRQEAAPIRRRPRGKVAGGPMIRLRWAAPRGIGAGLAWLGYAGGILLLCELVARFVFSLPIMAQHRRFHDELSWRRHWIERHRRGDRIRFGFDRYDPLTGWRVQPDLHDLPVFGTKTLNTNSKGARGRREYAYGRPPNVT